MQRENRSSIVLLRSIGGKKYNNLPFLLMLTVVAFTVSARAAELKSISGGTSCVVEVSANGTVKSIKMPGALGDIGTVKITGGNNCSAVIVDGNKEKTILNNVPTKIGEGNVCSSVAGNIGCIIAKWGNDLMEFVKALKSGPTDLELNMPLLGNKEDSATIVVASKELYLTWYGGKKPYSLSITDEKGKMVWSSPQPSPIQGEQIGLPGEKFGAGHSYKVVVTDGSKTVTTGYFKVESTLSFKKNEDIQKMPQSVAKQVLLATELATQENGKWRLEA